MIVVWDNGQDYSDHRIEFVDIGEHDPRVIGPAMVGIRGGEVLAVAPVIEWWTGGAQPLADFLWRIESDAREHWLAMPVSVRAEVRAERAKSLAEYIERLPATESAKRFRSSIIAGCEAEIAFLDSLESETAP